MRSEFEQGLHAGADPLNAAPTANGPAHTTLESSWLHQRCPLCVHTFRIGDHVVFGRVPGRVTHTGEGPGCDVAGNDMRQLTALRDFFRGLVDTIPVAERAVVRYLLPGDELLAPPVHGFSRSQCAVCGHTLRPFDSVVICPCKPDQQLCRTAIHHDPSRGMHCWLEWKLATTQDYCLTTSRKQKP
jgi:hypothetical protein